jgi:DNA helicase-2/ATP-dependent DNA helicase PcrA
MRTNLRKPKKSLGWDFGDSKQTKELNLTHNLIAPKAGFTTLMKIYDGDKILDYKRRITDYIKSHDIATDFSGDTFGGVIEKLLEGQAEAERKPILPTPGMQTFIDDNKELFEKAKRCPFETFRKIYLDSDSLLDDKKQDEDDESSSGSKRDNLIKQLFKIQTNVNLYREKKFNEFLRNTEFKIQNVEDKKRLKNIIEHLEGMGSNTIEEVLDYADKEGICKLDDKFNEFVDEKSYVFDRVKQVEFSEFQNLFSYLEGYTPFSTQHGIKGAEFNNVLVVLDNGNWNKYNFEYLLNENIVDTLTPARKRSFATILDRTQKLFYVCCTRAKRNLVVFYQSPSDDVIDTARAWFGAENVSEI